MTEDIYVSFSFTKDEMDIFSLVLLLESSREHSLLSATFLLVWGEKNKRRSVCLFLIFPFVLFCFFVLFCLCCCCCCYLLCVVSYSSFLRASVSVSVMYTIVYSAVRFGRRRRCTRVIWSFHIV